MILVDANIPMYLVGADHPNKHAAAAAIESAVAGGQRLVTDAEVLQEVLHRFVAIKRPLAIQPAFDVLLSVVEETFPVELADVQIAKEVVQAGYQLSARDALHIAIMRRHGLD
ncbi:MAG: type II toxin-antitoxin system VapC family toxin, partial [Pseudonocardiales bacterium]|nr:type II toxin-antitoxin system VapC family toxin [Pseudonocardiales bacterium]